MQILRHSKIAVMMEIYTHIPSGLTRTALHRLGDQLDRARVSNCCTLPLHFAPRITTALIPDRERTFDLWFYQWS